MGLLDSDFGKLLFGSTTMMKDREIARQAERYEGLLGGMGSPATAGPPSLMGDVTSYPYQEETGPTGLMGGQVTPEQFGAQAAAIPGYKDFGANLMMQGMRGDQAMDRQTQEQQYYGDNMTQYQRGMLEQRKAEVVSQLSGRNMDDIMKFQGQLDKEIEPYQVSVRNANSVDNMVDQMGYDNAASQQFIVSKALSTIRPGEAQMEGDIRALARAAGFKGEIKDGFTWLLTNSAKDPRILKGLHSMIRTQATLDQKEIINTGSRLQRAYNFDDRTMKMLTWGDETSENPYAAPKISWDE